jgi:hypothetical protein
MLRHISPKACAKVLFAQNAAGHADNSRSFAVRNRIKNLLDFFGMLDRNLLDYIM